MFLKSALDMLQCVEFVMCGCTWSSQMGDVTHMTPNTFHVLYVQVDCHTEIDGKQWLPDLLEVENTEY